MRAVPVVAFGMLALALAGCTSLAEREKAVAAQMQKVAATTAAASGLPECAAGAENGYFVVSETTVLSLAKGGEWVETGKAGAKSPCAGVSIDGEDVTRFANRFNPEGLRKSAAKTLLAAKGFAVVVVEESVPPGPRGMGSARGKVVIVGGDGTGLCQKPFSAKNGDKVYAQVDKTSAKLGFGPSEGGAVMAWEGDLSTRTCRAIEATIPGAPRYAPKKK